jgi:hypothetical protein
LSSIIRPAAVGLRGIITLYCVRRDGKERPGSRIRRVNRIVDAGLNALMGGAATNLIITLTNWVGVGDNATAVADGQTALQNPIKLDGVNFRSATTHTNDATASVGGAAPNYYASQRRVLKFAAATANATVRELGFFSAAAAGTMWNRLVVTPDYTVLTGEELVVDMELRYYVPSADASGTVTISGVVYDYTVRALNAQASGTWADYNNLANFGGAGGTAQCSNTAGLVAQNAAGPAATAAASATAAAYVAGTFYRDVEYVWDPATFTSSIAWLKFWNSRLQMSVSPVLPKTNLNRLRLTFRHQFTRL